MTKQQDIANDFEIGLGGKKYPILWRKKGSKETDACPFCGRKHSHGSMEGHRVAHCAGRFVRKRFIEPKEFKALLTDGTYAEQRGGYIIREYE